MALDLGGGRYLLGEVVGSGGSATVYRATDVELGVTRAIKVLVAHRRGKAGLRARLRAEARAMAQLDHPNVLRVYDVSFDGDTDFVVMELAERGSLSDLLENRGPLSPRDALAYAVQVLSALAAAHHASIVHRDVKPQNILIDKRGVALLADFGIALLAEGTERRTRTGVAMGSVAFMAPEQRLDARSVGPAADIYAMGATLYNLITGRNPVDLFAAEIGSERWRDLQEDLVAVIRKATSYLPADRHASAGALAGDLIRLLPDAPSVPVRVLDPDDPLCFPAPSERFSSVAGSVATLATLTPPPPPDLGMEIALERLRPHIPALEPSHIPTLSAEVQVVGGVQALSGYFTAIPESLVPMTPRQAPTSPLWLGVALLVATLLCAGLLYVGPSLGDRLSAAPSPAAVVVVPERTSSPAVLATGERGSAPVPSGAAVEVTAPTLQAPGGASAAAVLLPSNDTKPEMVAPPRSEVSVPKSPISAESGWEKRDFRGSFGGRPAELEISIKDGVVRGLLTSKFGQNEIVSRVAGTYNQDMGSITLRDIDESDPSAGEYLMRVTGDWGRLDGQFHGTFTGHTTALSLRSSK